MKIWGEVPKVTGVYDRLKKISGTTSTPGTAAKKDEISISNQAKDFQTVFKALRDVPDIRLDKVNELNNKYNSGNYKADGKDTADKIISSIIDKKA